MSEDERCIEVNGVRIRVNGAVPEPLARALMALASAARQDALPDEAMAVGRRLRDALVSYGIDYAQEASDALAPVVAALVREGAAAELEAAAEDWSDFRLPTAQLRDRAAALRAQQ